MEIPPFSHAYVARQPIVDAARHVIGYELLFRSVLGAASTGFQERGSKATARVLANSVLVEGLDSLVGDVRAWVNLPEQFIVDGIPELLSPHQYVLEVLQGVCSTPQVIEGCHRLRESGFTVAMDDVVSTERLRSFPGCFDLVKVNWLSVPPSEIEPIVREAKRVGAGLLAERLETEAAVKEAQAAGFDLFQGFALGFPQNIQRRNLSTFNAHALQLLQIVNRENFDYGEVEAIVRVDPALTYKLLAFANSALAGQAQRIRELRHALVLFGERNLRHAAMLVFLAQMPGRAPQFALIEALVGGLFCESLARSAGRPDLGNTCMLSGTLAHMDRLLGEPLPELIDRLPVDRSMRDALLLGAGPVGSCVQLMRAYQSGDWSRVANLAAVLGLSDDSLQMQYRRSVALADEQARGDAIARARVAA